MTESELIAQETMAGSKARTFRGQERDANHNPTQQFLLKHLEYLSG
jgi:hypothetical protein